MTSTRALAAKGRLGDSQLARLSLFDKVIPAEFLESNPEALIELQKFTRLHQLDFDGHVVGWKTDGVQHFAPKDEEGQLAHVQPGDVIFPFHRLVASSGAYDWLSNFAQRHGLDDQRFTAGSGANRINPRTGLVEFEDADGSGGAEGSGGGDPRGEGATPGAMGGDLEGAAAGVRDAFGQAETEAGGVKSASAMDAEHSTRSAGMFAKDPSDYESDLSLGNRLGNFLQSEVATPFAFDPFGFVAKTALNMAFSAVPIGGMLNTLSGAVGGPTFGGAMVGMVDPTNSNSNAGRAAQLAGNLGFGPSAAASTGVSPSAPASAAAMAAGGLLSAALEGPSPAAEHNNDASNSLGLVGYGR